MNASISALKARLADDDTEAIALSHIPYFELLGLQVRKQQGELVTILPYTPELIGNPMPARLHGGSLGTLLEAAGMLAVIADQAADEEAADRLAKPIGLTVDYLRPGEPAETCANATILRRGRRIASVRSRAWQDAPSRPIAAAMLHFLL